MTEVFLSEGRAKVLRRLLYVTLGLAAVVALIGLVVVLVDPQRYVVTLFVVAVVLAVVGGLALRAVLDGSESAKRLCVVTAVLLIVCSLPLVGVLVGMLTVIAGVGLLVVVLAPERDAA